MKKKLLALLLTATCAMSMLAGCGSGEAAPAADGGASTTTQSSDSTATPAADAPASGEVSTVVILYPGEETDSMANFIDNQLNPRLAEEVGIQVELVYKGWSDWQPA